MVEAGPNLVTPEGFAAIEGHVARLESELAKLARDASAPEHALASETLARVSLAPRGASARVKRVTWERGRVPAGCPIKSGHDNIGERSDASYPFASQALAASGMMAQTSPAVSLGRWKSSSVSPAVARTLSPVQ